MCDELTNVDDVKQQRQYRDPEVSLALPHSAADRSSTMSMGEQDYGEETAEEQAAEDEKMKAQQGRARRAGVAAESVSTERVRDYKKPVHPKDDATKESIKEVLRKNEKMQVLCGHLDGEPLADLINAFYAKDIAQGQDIIKQGDHGDCLYIISQGAVDVFVARPGPDGKVAAGDRGSKVVTLGSGSLFGELALMYNAPRAATVTAASPTVSVFVLDAMDFKMLLAQQSQAQYARYQGWLAEVQLLKSLNHYELSKLAEALESEVFDSDEAIIQQGDAGDKFYILEDGTAAAYIDGANGEMEVKTYEKMGDFFGEVALLSAAPRKATVRATGGGCAVVSLSKENFTNLLGPISDLLKGKVGDYPQYADFLK